MRPLLLGSFLAASALAASAPASAAPPARTPLADTSKSVLSKRLRSAYRAVGLKGRAIAQLDYVGKAIPSSGAEYANANYLHGVRFVKPMVDIHENVEIKHLFGRVEKFTMEKRGAFEQLPAQAAALRFDEHLARTGKLEEHLMGRLDHDFTTTRAAWNAKLKAATTSTEKLASRAVELIQELNGMASGRDARQIKTGEGSLSSSTSSSHSSYGFLGNTKSTDSSSHAESMHIDLHSLVLGASTYRIDLVEKQHLSSLDGMKVEQMHTPEARLLVERVLQATEIVEELQRRDAASDGTASKPFTRWLQESTVEVAPPKKVAVEEYYSLKLTTHQKGETQAVLQLNRFKNDLVEKAAKFDFMSPGFSSTIKGELSSSKNKFVDELPSLD